jgi:hypothetical protein
MIAEFVAVDDLEKKIQFDETERGRNATMLFFCRAFAFSNEMKRGVCCVVNLRGF